MTPPAQRTRTSTRRASSHRCPAPGCRIYVPMHLLACKTHWFTLPERLRRELNRTFRRDDRAHLQHFREAIRLLAALPLPEPKQRRTTNQAPPQTQLGIFTGEELTTMSKPAMFRQGDVLLIPTESIPDDAQLVARDNERIVLAYGEATGHAHAILEQEAKLFALTDSEVDDRFLHITSSIGADLVHEEHSTIHLPRGDYIVRRQREYEPQAAPRTVAD
jgi:hypothetical protein